MQNLNRQYYSMFLFFFLVPLREVIEKYLMENYFMSPYRLICFESVAEVFILIMVCLVPPLPNQLIYFESWKSFGFSLKSLFTSEYTYLTMILLINNNCFNVLRVVTNQNYHPIQRYIADNLCLCYAVFLYFIEEEALNISHSFKVFTPIFLVITVIGNLIYTEVLVINLFGLSRNVRREIIKRTVEDEDMIMSMNNDSINLELEEIEIE